MKSVLNHDKIEGTKVVCFSSHLWHRGHAAALEPTTDVGALSPGSRFESNVYGSIWQSMKSVFSDDKAEGTKVVCFSSHLWHRRHAIMRLACDSHAIAAALF